MPTTRPDPTPRSRSSPPAGRRRLGRRIGRGPTLVASLGVTLTLVATLAAMSSGAPTPSRALSAPTGPSQTHHDHAVAVADAGAGAPKPPGRAVSRPAVAMPAADAVIAAAGDIACDPASPGYHGGTGGPNACHMRAVAGLLVKLDPKVVLTLGDNQYENGTLTKFRASYHPSWGRIKGRTRPAVGNHEYGTAGAAGYFDYFGAAAGKRGQGWYSYDVGAWHLVALNSECAHVGGCGPDSAQVRWLRADLAAHPARCTLAYWHKPRFSSGMHGNDATYDAFWRVLYGAGVDLVLNGHDHDYERFAPQAPDGTPDAAHGIREFVVGTGGKTHYGFHTIRANSQARNTGTFGALRLRLRQTGYDWRFVPEPGKTFTDGGHGACH